MARSSFSIIRILPISFDRNASRALTKSSSCYFVTMMFSSLKWLRKSESPSYRAFKNVHSTFRYLVIAVTVRCFGNFCLSDE